MDGQQVADKKLVIWVTGGKGGTGKSTFARAVLSVLAKHGIDVFAVDGDPENAQLYRYCQGVGNGVVRAELAKRQGGDNILDAMERKAPSVVLADVAAGGSQILMRLQDESLFLSDAAELGYQFTVVSLLSPIKDSINMLKQAMDTTHGYDVRHVAVKNLHFQPLSLFELFDSSKTKRRFEAEGGIVLTMRELFSPTYALVDEQNLPFHIAEQVEGGLENRGDRNRVKQWLNIFETQMKEAKGRLWL